jgi:hypothetical protein
MRRLGTESWRIAVDRSNLLFDFALWLRAVERIDVPPDPFVAGPLDDEPAAEPTAGAVLSEAWLGWWRDLIGLPPWTFAGAEDPLPHLDLSSPDALGLARWPELQRVVMARWEEGTRWHRTRRPPQVYPGENNVGDAAIEVERELGRPLRPFRLDLVLLPVRDTTVRQVTSERYLVPERVFDGLRGARWLTDLLRRIG